MKSNVDLYTNADKSKVVTADDPDARFLLVRAGKNIPDGEISQIGSGLLSQARELGKSEEAEEKQIDGPAEDKAISAPAENKAAGKSDEKSK